MRVSFASRFAAMPERPSLQQEKSTIFFVINAATAAFLTYFCMYAFRKPFTVASYTQAGGLLGIDFKSALVIAQVFGYALSKFIGIRVIAEMTAAKRATTILVLVMAAQSALIAFAILPVSWKLLALFLNGLPLGMIWGLVFSYLEGRRTTEILAAILSVSFIVSTGVVKTVGQFLMAEMQVSEYWMPATTGALFTLPLFLSVKWMASMPPPSALDTAVRKVREPMSGSDRLSLMNRYFTGLTCLTIAYMLLSAIRDFSDNYAAEIWYGLGYGNTPGIFSVAALYASLIVLGLLGCVVWIRNHFRALMVNLLLIVAGFACLGLSSLLFQRQVISGLTWMICLTVSIYLAYVPFNCILFERLVCLMKGRSNAGFLIYVADASGYAGGIGILLFKSIYVEELSWRHFLIDGTYFVSLLGMALVLVAAMYFRRRFIHTSSQPEHQAIRHHV